MKFSLLSLGCAKNLVDSEFMLQQLEEQSFVYSENPEDADIIIVNTCGFIEPAKRESIDTILQLLEYKKYGRCQIFVVTGCLVQRYAQELAKEIPEIDIFLGTSDFHSIGQAITKLIRTGVTDSPYNLVEDSVLLQNINGRLTPRHLSYIKIAEGCNNRCSYCIIPVLRGPLRSRSAESIYEEVRSKLAAGAQELILVAQDLTQYGLDKAEDDALASLLSGIEPLAQGKWIRLLYTYPHGITRSLIDVLANSRVVVPYLDIPMQHGCNEILRKMNRRDRREDMIRLVHTLRDTISDIAIRSSFIVGFPGETDQQFNELLEFLQEIQLDRAGFFHYSQEEGTPAANMPGQVAEDIKAERYQRALACQEIISTGGNRQWISRTMTILVEEKTENEMYPYAGRSYRDAPEVDGQVYIQGNGLIVGQFAKVHIDHADAYDLFGHIVSDRTGE